MFSVIKKHLLVRNRYVKRHQDLTSDDFYFSALKKPKPLRSPSDFVFPWHLRVKAHSTGKKRKAPATVISSETLEKGWKDGKQGRMEDLLRRIEMLHLREGKHRWRKNQQNIVVYIDKVSVTRYWIRIVAQNTMALSSRSTTTVSLPGGIPGR